MTDIKVSELRIHPIKGFKRTMLEVMPVMKAGPINDRRLMLIDADNTALTQRTHSLMATVDVKASGNEFSLCIPGKPPFTFQVSDEGTDLISATIWKSTVSVVEVSSQASLLLSKYLETPCRLVGMAHNHKRMVKEKYSKSGTDETLFTDGFPFLLISQESLDDLNGRLDAPVPMDRFRPNIVITGCAPFEEDKWETIQIGDMIFDLPKDCSRCIVTTIDQETGQKDKEKGKNPLKALARYRNTERGIMFGQNMLHRSQGILSLGQSVKVLKRREAALL